MSTNTIVEPLASPHKESEIPSTIRKIFSDFHAEVIQLVQDQGIPEDAASFRKMEEDLASLCFQISSHVMAALLTVIHSRIESTSTLVPNDSSHRYRYKGMRKTVVTFLSGLRMRVSTPYWARIVDTWPGRRKKDRTRGKGGTGMFPILESLGIRWKSTPALISQVAQFSASLASYKEASRCLACWGIHLCTSKVRQLTRKLGKEALKERTARVREAIKLTDDKLLAEGELVGKRIVIGIDGGRVRIRVGKRGKKRAKGKRQGFQGVWREPKLFTIHIVNRKGKKIKNLTPLYDATLGDADAVFDLLIAELKLRGARYAKQIIVVGDGALWIWERVNRLVEELGIDRKRIVEVLDFYHACEHLYEVADEIKGWNEKKRNHWVGQMKNFLRKGKIDTVLTEIDKLAVGRRKKKIETQFNYFDKNLERMSYKEFKRRGIPCGSGNVESAIRRVINLRMKGNGIFWKEEAAEEMLHMRSYLKAGRWEELLGRVHGTGPPVPQHLIDKPEQRASRRAA